MRVGLDARFLGLPGIGRFTVELWRGLLDLGVEVLGLGQPWGGAGWLGQHPLLAPGPTVPLSARPFTPTEQIALRRAIDRHRIDVHHSPHLAVPYLAPVPVVLTVHDLVPLQRDGNARSRAAALAYRVLFPLALRRADVVVAVSSWTADAIGLRFPPVARKVRVIGHGIDLDQWRAPTAPSIEPVLRRLGVDRPYFLYVGTAKRQKNLPTLLAAMSEAHPTLVIAGATAAELGPTPAHVSVLGRVSDADLVTLYGGAVALVLPSRYEGVGLTALEAMACGTPVIASTGGALRETVGDAAILVDPMDVGGWRAALTRVAQDPDLRIRLAAAGRAHVAGQTWRIAAGAYVEAYEAALAARRR
jgi:glycosyltransferase involved in cell wall biosynthesis